MVKYTSMKQSMQLHNDSINRAGLPKDYKEVIKQYLWNAIEADATDINIKFSGYVEDEELPALETFEIEDNGHGINYEELDSTFGSFLHSNKTSRLTKGGKGKGRLSFLTVAAKAVWKTTYTNPSDGNNYFYTLTIEEGGQKDFDKDKPHKVLDGTGTTVEFRLLKGNFNRDDLLSEKFEQFLALEFGWYLGIFERNKVTIRLNGTALDYGKYVEESEEFEIDVTPVEQGKAIRFNVEFVEWNDKIGTDSYIYLLHPEKGYIGRTPTGFNQQGGRAYGFVHSLYVQSEYFDNFELSRDKSENTMLALDGIKLNQNDAVYKELLKQLKNYIAERKRQFLKSESENIIEKFRKNKTLPEFTEGPLGDKEREDFYGVVKGVYKAAPTFLTGLRHEHEKSMLSFIQLTLKTDEREHILDIVGEVVELSPDERANLASLLKSAKLSGVIKLLNTLRSRYSVIELIKVLVFINIKSTTERAQLQKAIEENCWIFGEEYNLIAADKSFKQLEADYLNFIEQDSSTPEESSERRPDVFITRSKSISTGITGSVQKKVNLIVELKRPSVVIGNEQYRQVEDYRNILRANKNYKSDMREWHMYVIGVDLTQDIRVKRDSLEVQNRPFLVNHEANFYIYALTWAEVFDSFEARHDYLLADVDMDREKLLADAGIDVIGLDSKQATEAIAQLSNDASSRLNSEKEELTTVKQS